MDVSHHGGSAYYDSSTMDGVKPLNGVTKHSPNGLDSEVQDPVLCLQIPCRPSAVIQFSAVLRICNQSATIACQALATFQKERGVLVLRIQIKYH